MGILDDWIEDMPQQFQGKERIEILISAFSKQLEELHKVFRQLDLETDLESAVGMNLDMVGDIVTLTRKEAGILAGVGMTEPVISDERYRQFLKYKILKNTTNCTYYDIMQSIEILWRTDNIKYYEDPNRPATILIKLQTIDVDSEIDPAFGKTLAVKPAGVTLIYTVNYIVIVDSSQGERFYFPQMRMHIALLAASRSYMPLALKQVFKGGVVDEEYRNFTVETRRNLWYLDGSLKLNGANILNAMIEKEVI